MDSRQRTLAIYSSNMQRFISPLATKIIHFSHLFMRKFHLGHNRIQFFPIAITATKPNDKYSMDSMSPNNQKITKPPKTCLSNQSNPTSKSMNKYNKQTNHPQIQVHQKSMHRSNHNETLNRNRD